LLFDCREIGIAVDTSGNAYITGYTTSTDFPTTPGAYQTNTSGWDTFVTKLNPTGSALVYSTYIPGGLFSNAIAVDANGDAYVAGWSAWNTYGFPTTPNAYSQSCGGSGFLTVLNDKGSGLIYSTCFGSGSGYETTVTSMAADAHGRAFISGYTYNGVSIPTTPNAYQTSYPGARGTIPF